MKRRQFLVAAGGVIWLWPAISPGQVRKPVRILQVSPWKGTEDLARSFEQKLQSLGHTDGKDIRLNNLYVAPQPDAIQAAIKAALPEVDLFVVWSTVASVNTKKVVAGSKPIVFLSVGVPVDIGLVDSLSRPNGNMTGITFEAATETYSKRLQLLLDVVPTLTKLAVLKAKGDPNALHAIAALERNAPKFGIQVSQYEVGSSSELPAAFKQMKQSGAHGLISIAGAFTLLNSQRIADLTLAERLPSCHGFKFTVASGGLISLGPDMTAIATDGATYVDKILRGAKPEELPVQQPTKMEVAVNLKTARLLGITVPNALLISADVVIE